MFQKFTILSGVLALAAQAAFVTRLVMKIEDYESNLQEYYGRIVSDVAGADRDDKTSKTFFAMLLSYSYPTQSIQLHFNMKEPASQIFPEIDYHWSTSLDLTG